MKRQPTRSKSSPERSSPSRKSKAVALIELSHAEEATKYAKDVSASKILACKWVILACKRHLADLKASRGKQFQFKFDAARAARACKFIEALPHTKGEWASSFQTVKLRPWQKFVICSLFGWVEKADPSKYRFREADVVVPRKNGKSILAAGIGLFKFAADGEFGAEVYSGATTERQAWEVFLPAKQMCERTPGLVAAFGIRVNAKGLVIERTGARFEPVIGKPGDGSSPSCAIKDEYHEDVNDDQVSTMRTGMGARKNPLLFKITTAGSDRSSPCFYAISEAQEILEGKRSNERRFVVIYTIDKDDDWTAEQALIKANPNYGVSVGAEWLREEQKQAVQSARLQNAFKTKHLDIWENADTSWMNMVAWEKAADLNLKIEQFLGEECFDGLDLASKIDLACKASMFRKKIDGKVHYYAFVKHYLNQAAVDAAKNSHYAGWAIDHRLVVTPGNVTDHGFIAADILEDCKRFSVREVPHDPYQSTSLMQFMQAQPDWNQNVELVAVAQSVQNLSGPMKELEAVVLDGRFHHDGDPVLSWMVSNVVCHRDAKDNIFPRKQREENKIDGVIAILVAMNRMMAQPEQGPSVYETRGLLII